MWGCTRVRERLFQVGNSSMMRSISILLPPLCALLLLTALSCPSDAHNGAVAIAEPVEGSCHERRAETKKQLIEELEASRVEVTDLREKVAGIDVDAVKRRLAVGRVAREATAMWSSDDFLKIVGRGV